ncbi:MAG: dihydroorotate dehydrogenase electron transfer subunit, partial [Thiohalomonadales bacterium]
GSVSFLYKVLGIGTQQLSQRKIGESLSLLGPIGNHFKPSRDIPLLIGGGVGIPPMIFLAESLTQSEHSTSPFVIMGSEVPFPFTPIKSKQPIVGIDKKTNAAMPLLEEWGIANRLTSKSIVNKRENLQESAGYFDGYVTELAELWLEALSPEQLEQVEIFSCGPHAMLSAVSDLANNYNIPCQVSLEEFMACAVGGCAGCVVEVATPQGPAMKRVCVDGPIFDSRLVFNNE